MVRAPASSWRDWQLWPTSSVVVLRHELGWSVFSFTCMYISKGIAKQTFIHFGFHPRLEICLKSYKYLGVHGNTTLGKTRVGTQHDPLGGHLGVSVCSRIFLGNGQFHQHVPQLMFMCWFRQGELAHTPVHSGTGTRNSGRRGRMFCGRPVCCGRVPMATAAKRQHDEALDMEDAGVAARAHCRT